MKKKIELPNRRCSKSWGRAAKNKKLNMNDHGRKENLNTLSLQIASPRMQ